MRVSTEGEKMSLEVDIDSPSESDGSIIVVHAPVQATDELKIEFSASSIAVLIQLVRQRGFTLKSDAAHETLLRHQKHPDIVQRLTEARRADNTAPLARIHRHGTGFRFKVPTVATNSGKKKRKYLLTKKRQETLLQRNAKENLTKKHKGLILHKNEKE